MTLHSSEATSINLNPGKVGLCKSLEEVKLLQSAGLDLFPLKAAAKIPRDRGWRLQDYSSLDWNDYLNRGGNVGVRARPGNLFVDVDARHRGLFSLEMLKWDVDDQLDAYPKVLTGRDDGGFHLYMSVPRGVPLRNKLRNYPGLDFQGLGRYVVGPGSTHPDTGGMYTIDPSQTLEVWRRGLPPCPAGLLELLRKPPLSRQAVGGGELSCSQLEQLLAALNPEDFGQGGRHHDEWLNLAMACHEATNGDGLEEWLSWCADDLQYGTEAWEQNTARWESFGSVQTDRVT